MAVLKKECIKPEKKLQNNFCPLCLFCPFNTPPPREGLSRQPRGEMGVGNGVGARRTPRGL